MVRGDTPRMAVSRHSWSLLLAMGGYSVEYSSPTDIAHVDILVLTPEGLCLVSP